MRINLSDILAIAEEKKCAIGAFNTPNLECVNAVIRSAEYLDVPVIIAHAQIHEYAAPLSKIGPVMIKAAENAKVPVCVHLDHCESFEYLQQALDLGFGGVMYDGSLLPYEENLANTKKAVEMVESYDCNVEAELGALATREDGENAKGSGPIYTDPDHALEFCKLSGIDVLAPSFGTAHGLYKSKPKLDFDLVEIISKKCKLPLVMHGGSGVSHEDYKKGIECGLRKINYYTYMSNAGLKAAKEAIKQEDMIFFHDVAKVVEEAMYQDVIKAMCVFSNKKICQ